MEVSEAGFGAWGVGGDYGHIEAAERFRFLKEEVGSMLLGAARYPLPFLETSTLILGSKSIAQAEANFGQVPGEILGEQALEKVRAVQLSLGLET